MNKARRENGFTLIELVLAITVLGVIAVGVSRVSADWAEGYVADGIAQHVKAVNSILEEFMSASSPGDLTAARGIELVADSQSATPSTNFGNFIPINFSFAGPGGVTLEAQVQTVLSDGTIGAAGVPGNPVVGYVGLVYSNALIDYGRVYKAASKVGYGGGVLSRDLPNSNNGQNIVGVYADWVIDRGDFTGIAAPSLTQGNVVSYTYRSLSETVGPYLYRQQVDCDGDGDIDASDVACNTMSTTLNMGGNNIDAADLVTSDSLLVTGQTTIGGQLTVSGNTVFNNTVAAAGGLDVTGNVTVGGDLSSLDVAVAQNVSVSGNVTAAEVQTSQLSSEEIVTNDLTVSGSSTTVMNSVTVAGGLQVDGFISADNINVNTINAVSAPNAEIYARSANISGGIVASGFVTNGDIIINNADLAVSGQILCADGSGTYGPCD